MDWYTATRAGVLPLRSTENMDVVMPERWEYLCPTRYFHFYLFLERKLRSTCWMPEGYMQ